MMIFGIAVTATIVGKMLVPYSPDLLLKIVAMVCAGAVALTVLAIAGIKAGLFMLAAGMAAKTIDAIRSAPTAALVPGE